MAWRVNAGTIARGESVRWYLSWDGDYRGLQYILARPLPTRSGGLIYVERVELIVSERTLKQEVDGGYTYAITVTNRGSVFPVSYELVGSEV